MLNREHVSQMDTGFIMDDTSHALGLGGPRGLPDLSIC